MRNKTLGGISLLLLLGLIVGSAPVSGQVEETEIAYDDDRFEDFFWWSWTRSPEAGGGEGLMMAVMFTPPGSPFKLLNAMFYVVDPASFKVRVFDVFRAPLPVEHIATPTEDGWFTVDLSGFNLELEGDFYIALEYLSTSEVGKPKLAGDASSPDDRSYWVNEGWEKTSDVAVAENNPGYYVDWGIRAVVEWPLFRTITIGVQQGVSDLVVDGDIVRAELLPASFEWEHGSTHTVTILSTIVEGDPGVRYVFDGWSDGTENPTKEITVTEDIELTALFKTQYLLEILPDYGKPERAGWYDSGTRAAIQVDSPVVIDEGTRVVFEGWTGDILSEERATSIIMDSPKTVVAEWKKQHFLTVNANGGTATGEGWYDEGSQAVAEVTSPMETVEGKERMVFTGWSGDSTETFTQTSLIMDSPKTVKANWKAQYHLTVEPGDGELDEESQWVDEGRSVTVTASTPSKEVAGQSRFVFTGWSGASTSEEPAASIAMDTYKTLTANWKTQYYLTIEDPSETVKGEGWYDEGSRIDLAAKSPEKLVEGRSRLIFKGWSGDLTSSDLTVTLEADSYKLVKANWQQEYYLKVSSELGDPQGEGWYKSGETTRFSVTSPLGVVIQDVFDGWSGDSQVKTPEGSTTMDSPKAVTANWRKDYTQLFIIVGVVAAAGAGSTVALRRKKK